MTIHNQRSWKKELDFKNRFRCNLQRVFSNQTKLLQAIGLPLTCIAMFSIAGGHWGVLQTLAWAKMLRTYSQDASIKVAVEKTFSGEHPCPLCLKVREGRAKEEKAPATVKIEKKAEVFVFSAREDLKRPFATDFHYPALASLFFPGCENSPPHPIPISHSLSA